MVGGQVRLNHHGHTLFPMPNLEQSTTTQLANWSYDDDTDAGRDDMVQSELA